ncbi:aspartic peptidase domain-containing protein [Crucibulum laeve]|uniref:Aspartic peptidase domain-containing protein n=1 Tax=Crucibulum laeve TaxID=68775 RepID=A0A5C3LE54_9AGAR|nr:aspartic peptidase domain-containing protein [Crucibulum laeve]
MSHLQFAFSLYFILFFYQLSWAQQIIASRPPVIVPLTTDINRRYVIQIEMANTTFPFALSLGTGYSLVAASDCTSCGSEQKYDLNSAPTAPIGSQAVSVLGASASGQVMQENCSMVTDNSSLWHYPEHPMVMVNQSSSLISSGISGILGLGTNRLNGNFSSSTLGGWLSSNAALSNVSFGLSLNPPEISSSDAGQLHWLAPDPSAYQGEVSWKDLITTTSLDSDWVFKMDSWMFNVTDGGSQSRNGGNMTTAVDPYNPNIIFPSDIAHSIHSSINGAVLKTQTSMSSVWSIPCDSRMSLTITVGTHPYMLLEDKLIQSDNGNCTSAIEGWTDNTNDAYLFGATFISSVYLIFTVNSMGHGSLGFAKRGLVSAKGLSPGAIAGITLGSLACAGILIVGIMVFGIGRQQRKAHQSMKERSESYIPPFVPNQVDSNKTTHENQVYESYSLPSVPSTPDYHDHSIPSYTTIAIPPTDQQHFNISPWHRRLTSVTSPHGPRPQSPSSSSPAYPRAGALRDPNRPGLVVVGDPRLGSVNTRRAGRHNAQRSNSRRESYEQHELPEIA